MQNSFNSLTELIKEYIVTVSKIITSIIKENKKTLLCSKAWFFYFGSIRNTKKLRKISGHIHILFYFDKKN
ncbi:hypothetical protein MXB_4076 [Myxobolus squamalis]|nr:hypothetical protein MXB_4076 [Myxobolus squamalis]